MPNEHNIRRELEESIRDYKMNQEHFEMAIKNMAEQMFFAYKEYIKAGFSEQQAFDLVKTRGIC